MNATDLAYLPEQPAHDHAIEAINEEAFGPGRFARAAQAIRDGGPHDRSLSFVALHGGNVIGSVRMTPVRAGEGSGHLLGPLAVMPAWKSKGVGRRLLAMAVEAARAAGSGVVVLVGDEPYYGPLGFRHLPFGQLAMPRPVDPARLLACELVEGSASRLTGMLVHANQAR
ncbi:GNAT family N-acetyltransferase [Zhengella mangrovi]|uniref:GNAT family N-acetyltransferase n=1 Tax=Zhengella mangrovi TaxID=1982044 RepID=A0A2G1QQ41_9HYPH|nr:N-acetyltransferase [Zhengella mangrovi]PHP67338.1 GNAT family N-acetyltransferase [Zhengella mangrovi]